MALEKETRQRKKMTLLFLTAKLSTRVQKIVFLLSFLESHEKKFKYS